LYFTNPLPVPFKWMWFFAELIDVQTIVLVKVGLYSRQGVTPYHIAVKIRDLLAFRIYLGIFFAFFPGLCFTCKNCKNLKEICLQNIESRFFKAKMAVLTIQVLSFQFGTLHVICLISKFQSKYSQRKCSRVVYYSQ